MHGNHKPQSHTYKTKAQQHDVILALADVILALADVIIIFS